MMQRFGLDSVRRAFFVGILTAITSSAALAQTCNPASSQLAGAHKVAVPGEERQPNLPAQNPASPTTPASPGTAPTSSSVGAPARETVALGDWISLEVTHLDELFAEVKCRNKPLVVYLDGQPVKDLTLRTGRDMSHLYVRLERTPANREAWGSILGAPGFEPRAFNIGLGVEGQPPLPVTDGSGLFLLQTLSAWPFVFACLCFLVLLIGFLYLLFASNIMRDASPLEDAVAIVDDKLAPQKAIANQGPFSLSKFQAAWWFFIVIAAYLLIGIVTWDFYSTISSTALILLGIGAGTVVGGTLIDRHNDTPEQAAVRKARAEELKTEIEQIDAAQEFCRLNARSLDLNAPQPANPPAALTQQEQAALTAVAVREGPDMPAWLRKVSSAKYAKIADLFELVSFTQQDEAAAANAAAAGAGRPDAEARLVELRKLFPEAIVKLCRLKAITALGGPIPPDLANLQISTFATFVPDSSEIAMEKATAISRYRKVTNQSEGWFTDVLSDANGVNFHRFQLLSWTVILGGVFAVTSYRELNMPVFDTTLMGLLGLSAGTYLGLKVPEPTIPPK